MDSNNYNENKAVTDSNSHKFKSKLSLLVHAKNSANAVYSTFCRFPFTMLLFIVLAALIIYRIETPYEKIKDINEILDRVSAVTGLGILFTLSMNLLFERVLLVKSILVRISIYIIELILLILYYEYLFPNTVMVPTTRLILISLALILAFLFIPYLFAKENFEIYTTRIITRVTTTAFFTVVLALGIVAILFAIKTLLYNGMNTKYYSYTWILAGFIFAPLHFLHGLPKINDTFGIEHYNKVLKILLLYIVLPIISVYTVVLYLYFGKIIITKVWPEGIVSYLVLSYTAVGIASIFLITPFREKNKWVGKFIFAYTKLIFPLLGMMFMSISIRIGEFGFTENRYFILVIGIWATLAMIFINVSKCKRNIMLPISLAIIALLTVCGPWNAFNISKSSQSNRFYNILTKYNMIQNSKIVNNNSTLESNDKKEIVEIIHYFDRSHSVSDLKYLPEGFDFNKMKEVFGFDDIKINDDFRREYFTYKRYEESPVTISGYNILLRFDTLKHFTNNNVLLEKEIKSGDRSIKIYVNNNYIMSLFYDNEEILKYDMQECLKTLNSKYGQTTDNRSIAPEDLKVVTENDKVKVMLLFDWIGGNTSIDNDKVKIDNVAVNILVKINGNEEAP